MCVRDGGMLDCRDVTRSKRCGFAEDDVVAVGDGLVEDFEEDALAGYGICAGFAEAAARLCASCCLIF
jgi:hypothetical protein